MRVESVKSWCSAAWMMPMLVASVATLQACSSSCPEGSAACELGLDAASGDTALSSGVDTLIVDAADPQCEGQLIGAACDGGVCSRVGVCLSLQDDDGDGYCPGGEDKDGNGDCLGAGESSEGLIEDCDENFADISPDAHEVCGDERDNDCNGFSDEADTACHTEIPEFSDNRPDEDDDGDGFCEVGQDNVIVNGHCRDDGEQGDGVPVDCNDTDAEVSPAAIEICDDGFDNDCDGFVDGDDTDCGGTQNDDPLLDRDGDGYCPGGGQDWNGDGDCSDVIGSGPFSFSEPSDLPEHMDCDDNNVHVNPSAKEICDLVDNDCDGEIDEDGVCPAGCQPYRKFGHAYLFCHGFGWVLWDQANAICNSEGYHLAKIETSAENEWLKSPGTFVTHGPGGGVWVGGHDGNGAHEGRWTWSMDQSPISFSDWNPGEPNNFRGFDEDCMELREDGRYGWNDLPCDHHRKHKFWCELNQ